MVLPIWHQGSTDWGYTFIIVAVMLLYIVILFSWLSTPDEPGDIPEGGHRKGRLKIDVDDETDFELNLSQGDFLIRSQNSFIQVTGGWSRIVIEGDGNKLLVTGENNRIILSGHNNEVSYIGNNRIEVEDEAKHVGNKISNVAQEFADFLDSEDDDHNTKEKDE